MLSKLCQHRSVTSDKAPSGVAFTLPALGLFWSGGQELEGILRGWSGPVAQDTAPSGNSAANIKRISSFLQGVRLGSRRSYRPRLSAID